MITLCVVSILTCIAVPGFKKAIHDFKLNAFIEDYTDLIKGLRAYHLVFDEWPADLVRAYIPPKAAPFVPQRLCLKEGENWRIMTTPFGETANGCNWDYDNADGGNLIRWGAKALNEKDYNKAVDYIQTLDFFKDHASFDNTNPAVDYKNSIYYAFPDIQ